MHSTVKLPLCTPFFEAGDDWRMVRGDLTMTREIHMETLTCAIALLDVVKLPGRGSRDPSGRLRKAMDKMITSRSR